MARKWSGDDFNGVNAQTAIEGVSVRIAGKDAFVNYVSPGQVNVQVPDGVGTGPVAVIVGNTGGDSDPFTVTARTTAGGLLAPASFTIWRQKVRSGFRRSRLQIDLRASLGGDPGRTRASCQTG